MSLLKKIFVIGIFLSILFAIDVPRIINYQGKFTYSGGSSTGGFYFKYELYQTETGGSPVWTQEPVSDADSIWCDNGLFSDTLGKRIDTVLSQYTTLYLQVSIKDNWGDSWTVLSPREKLLASPWALAIADSSVSQSKILWDTDASNDADSISAIDIPYKNSGTGLSATNIQDAIDEFHSNLPSGDGDYIWNQDTAAQTAGFHISDDGEVDGDFYVGGDLTVLGQMQSGSPIVFIDTIDMSNLHIINLADPSNPQDAATKAYVDSHTGSGGFQQLRADGNAWLTDSVTLISGDALLTQTGDSITFSVDWDTLAAYADTSAVWDTLNAYPDTSIVWDTLAAYLDTTNHFILNQDTVAQSGGFWLDGNAKIEDTTFIGTADAYIYKNANDSLMFRDPIANGGNAISLDALYSGGAYDNIFVNETGDTMSGNLDMDGNNILHVDTISAIPDSQIYNWQQTSVADWDAGAYNNTESEVPGDVRLEDKIWYNPAWTRRVKINITNTTGADLTGYQIRLDVAYDGDMNNDFSDLRFTDNDGVSDIDFYVEEYTLSTNAIVWVEVPSIPTTGAYIFMYYGNPAATSASNFSNTFPDNLIIDGVTQTLGGLVEHDWIEVRNGGTINISSGSILQLKGRRIKIDNLSSINGNGRGESGGARTHTCGEQNNGSGTGAGTGGYSTGNSDGPGGGGGGYGGTGGSGGGSWGSNDHPGPGGGTYGASADATIFLGSGGGAGGVSCYSATGYGGAGGNGGGAVELDAGAITIDGDILVNGEDGENGYGTSWSAGNGGGGGGSGGTILLEGSVVEISGNISANGGDGGARAAISSYGGAGGGGGGGRIKVFYETLDDAAATYSVSGGANGGPSYEAPAAANGSNGTNNSAFLTYSQPTSSMGPEEIYQLYYSTGDYTSQIHDFGSVIQFTTFDYDVTLNSQNINFDVQVSNDGFATIADNISFAAADGSNSYDISSLTAARYVRVLTDFSGDGSNTPYLHDFTVNGKKYMNRILFTDKISVIGDIECTGKVTSAGGYDPPYVGFTMETRKAIVQRIKKEVPKDKLEQAILFWNSETNRLEIYLPSKGEFRDLQGNLLLKEKPLGTQ